MKASELQDKDRTALTQELHALLKERFNLNMLRATQQLNDNSKFKKVRRNIARVLTVMNQKAEQ